MNVVMLGMVQVGINTYHPIYFPMFFLYFVPIIIVISIWDGNNYNNRLNCVVYIYTYFEHDLVK